MTKLKNLALALVATLPTTAFADWNGAYGGFSFGPNVNNEIAITGDVSGDFDADDSTTFGIFGGYQVQTGSLVYGGEIAFSKASDVTFTIEGDDFTGDYDFIDLKGRLGYDLGNILAFGVLGFSQIDDGFDTASGLGFGFGADYAINDNIIVGAEYLARRTTFDDFDDFEVNVDTLAIRAAFKF